MRRLVAASRGGGSVDEGALPARLLEWTWHRAAADRPGVAPPGVTHSPVGEEELRKALRDHDWRINATARALGISRTHLYSLKDRSSGLQSQGGIYWGSCRRRLRGAVSLVWSNSR